MGPVQCYFANPLSLNLIKETFQESFHRSFDSGYWEWRFLNNPNSDKVYISYIIDKGILASYYAVSPCIIEKNGKERKIALSNMTMTHPAYQGKGLFKQIALSLFEQLKQDGYLGVFGFANQNSHYGFRKNLGWIDLASLNSFRISIDEFRNGMIKETCRFTYSLQQVDATSFNNVSSYRYSTSSVSLSRNKEHLRWRFSDNPQNEYSRLILKEGDQDAAFLIVKFYGGAIDVMEFFYHTVFENEKEMILGAAIDFLLSKAEHINIWSNLHTKEHLYLEKLGFREREFSTYFGVIPFHDDTALTDYHTWHYRFMDSDVY